MCGASLRGAQSSIWTAAVRSRQGLGTLRARTRPSGRRLSRSRQGLGLLLGAHTSVRMAAGVAWHLFSCRGSLRVVRPLRVRGTRRPLLLGTCPRAVVVAGGLPLWCASWPRVVPRAPSGPVALSAPVGLPDAVVPFPFPGACTPGFTGWLRGARGGRPRNGFIVPAVGPRRGAGAGLAPCRTRSGPRDGLPLAGFSGVGPGLRALWWLAAVDPVTDASSFRYPPSLDCGLGQCTRVVSCGPRHLPLRVGGCLSRVPCVCACARPCWPGQASQPPGRVVVRLTFSFGRFVFLLCSAPSRLGLTLACSFVSLPFFFALVPLRPSVVSCFL